MIQTHPDHAITVTGGGPFGRAWVDCSCGYTLTCPSKYAATRAALRHHHEFAGCNCPPDVVASDAHPEAPARDAPGRSLPGLPDPAVHRNHLSSIWSVMNYPAAPQYPQYPQQPQVQQFPGYPQAPTQPQFPQQGYPAQAPQGYPPPPQQPAQPLAQGSLDDYFNQPSSGGGPSISWSVNGMPKPEGTSYVGIVARDVTNADVQQQTDPKTGQPKFYRDGRPQFVMKVPLKVQPSQEFPEGEAVLFVRGQMRDELVRAMTEAGITGNNLSPKGGDGLAVTLVQRKPSRGGGMPMNVFAIRYQAGPGHNGQQQAPQGADAPSPAPAPQAPAQPVPAPQQVAPQQFAQQQTPATLAGQPNPFAQPGAAGADPFPLQQFQQPAQAPAPQQVAQPAAPQGGPQPPADLSPEQKQLLATLTGGAQQ